MRCPVLVGAPCRVLHASGRVAINCRQPQFAPWPRYLRRRCLQRLVCCLGIPKQIQPLHLPQAFRAIQDSVA